VPKVGDEDRVKLKIICTKEKTVEDAQAKNYALEEKSGTIRYIWIEFSYTEYFSVSV